MWIFLTVFIVAFRYSSLDCTKEPLLRPFGTAADFDLGASGRRGTRRAASGLQGAVEPGRREPGTHQHPAHPTHFSVGAV